MHFEYGPFHNLTVWIEPDTLEILIFDVIRDSKRLYDKSFFEQYDEDTVLFGSLRNVVNFSNIGISQQILQGRQLLFH